MNKGKKIVFKNITKKYGDSYIYKKFNLTIKPGEVTAILGPSGCGKTTLLNMLTRLTDYEGEITQAKCGYVLQDPALVPSLTVYQNLQLVNKDDKAIAKALQYFELTNKRNEYPINLSQGQRHRVALARALIYESDVILMDEPFSTLDLKLRIKLMELFASEAKNLNKTVIFVTHDLDETIVLAERAIVLNQGKIVYDRYIDDKIPRVYGSRDDVRQELIKSLIK